MSGPRAAVHDRPAETRPRVRPEIAAEASVWVARLHGPDRSPQMERECLAWQARSAEHREAFERCTETWQDVPNVSVANAYAAASGSGAASVAGRRLSLRWAGAGALAVVLAGTALLVQQWRDPGVYSTGVGEQHQVLLADGTRMSLNTGTRVRVDLGADRRSVKVEGGEALFEVGKDPKRPFVVRVAGSEVEALGTTFAVRFTPDDSQPSQTLTVTLIEGQVAVRPLAGGGGASGVASGQGVRLQAGERVRLSAAAPAAEVEAVTRVDRPNIDAVMAWKRSEAVFDDAALPDAVAEINRYTRTPIVLLDARALASLRVSGLYRTSDSAGFARAVAALHGLSVHERQGRLELARPQ
jgi:transmembrane sensor